MDAIYGRTANISTIGSRLKAEVTVNTCLDASKGLQDSDVQLAVQKRLPC